MYVYIVYIPHPSTTPHPVFNTGVVMYIYMISVAKCACICVENALALVGNGKYRDVHLVTLLCCRR